MSLLPPDEDLDLLHTRNYEVRVYQHSDDELLVRGAVSDLKPPGLYVKDDAAPLEMHQMQIELRVGRCQNSRSPPPRFYSKLIRIRRVHASQMTTPNLWGFRLHAASTIRSVISSADLGAARTPTHSFRRSRRPSCNRRGLFRFARRVRLMRLWVQRLNPNANAVSVRMRILVTSGTKKASTLRRFAGVSDPDTRRFR